MALKNRLAAWLKNRVPELKGTRGHPTAVADDVGLSQAYMSRLFSGEYSADVRLTQLEKIARTVGKETVADLVEEIENYGGGPVIVPVDDQVRRLWEQVFRRNPRKGLRVLENLRLQEELGYTETISMVVHEIIRRGPRDATAAVVAQLDKLQREETAQARRKRLRVARQITK